MTNEPILLSPRDFERFLEAIENPAEPTLKFKEAAEAYKALREANPDSGW